VESKFFEKRTGGQLEYDGKYLKVRLDDVELINGHAAKRVVVEHPGGVGVLAVTPRGDVVLVRQYRYPVGEELLEIPAGKLERGEIPLDCAKRELSEETGYSASEWQELGFIYTSPGYSDERLYLFRATGLITGDVHPDNDEFVETVEIPFAELLAQVKSGALRDAKTVAAAARAALADIAI
jgi:ADP-ribose pyrophosphatase